MITLENVIDAQKHS